MLLGDELPRRAWAVTFVAKEAQPNFICLAYNLWLILNRRVDREADKIKSQNNEVIMIDDSPIVSETK
jgi:hypothetical protein